MELIFAAVFGVLGFAGGAFWYHHNLKRHPEKIAKIVADVEAAKAKASQFRS